MSQFYKPITFLRPSVRIISKVSLASKYHQLATVGEINGLLNAEALKREDVDTQKPFVVRWKQNHDIHHPISISTWFSENNNGFPQFTPFLNNYLDIILPYELILPPEPENSTIKRFISWLSNHTNESYSLLSTILNQEITALNTLNDNNDDRFLRFDAPLALLSAGLQYNSSNPREARLTQLYIAQAPLPNLPSPLQADLATPSELLSYLGKGDIYGSSIWLGLEPTYTPWHRDPNPNLFCQLRGKKVLRLMPPNRGRSLFERVQANLGASGPGQASWRIRGDEMMQGPERRALMKAVWFSVPDSDLGMAGTDSGMPVQTGMYETALRPGDLMYLPKGWWHSVRSVEETAAGPGSLNASVNWWFR